MYNNPTTNWVTTPTQNFLSQNYNYTTKTTENKPIFHETYTRNNYVPDWMVTPTRDLSKMPQFNQTMTAMG